MVHVLIVRTVQELILLLDLPLLVAVVLLVLGVEVVFVDGGEGVLVGVRTVLVVVPGLLVLGVVGLVFGLRVLLLEVHVDVHWVV